ncbi:purine-nucleoside phosphorylase [Buchnera aphidicola]|uniref:purine-nucleoside phosphorylase n=1 Tax=Buchnera aphidicola TaxID=9 RepID=UPI0030EC4406
MITPHINAKKKDFSENVIIAGDPNRVKYITKKFLKNFVSITNVRGMLGFTGYFKGKKISVMSHGMGIPSLSIYVHELVNFYKVKKIIRVGTCGSVNSKIKLKDIILGMGACTDSSINKLSFKNYNYSAISNFKLLYKAYNISKKKNISIKIGNIFSTDLFYNNQKNFIDLMNKYNILSVEMETSELYRLSAILNFKSLSICTVSDCLIKNISLSISDRILLLDKAIKIALEIF